MKFTVETDALEFHREDSGQALIADVFNDVGEYEPHMFVRVQSWDDNKQHVEARKLEGKSVRVTVEEIKQPIYERKAGYELGTGDFLIQLAQRLDQAMDDQDWMSVYEVRAQLNLRIGTTPHTPDGCRIPYYPV